MRVSLFITCFNDTLFPHTGQAVVRLLERLGHTVDFPLEQTCCGQMHFNTGYQYETIPLARRFVRVFADAEVVVAPSASCVGMVRDMYPRVAELAADTELAAEIHALTPRVFELVELPAAEECCGFGGTFAVKNADTSLAMLGDKVRCVLDTGAEICTAADNSCLMHIGGALHRQRAGVRTVHIAEILASTDERGGT